jgi:hypothetical protein
MWPFIIPWDLSLTCFFKLHIACFPVCKDVHFDSNFGITKLGIVKKKVTKWENHLGDDNKLIVFVIVNVTYQYIFKNVIVGSFKSFFQSDDQVDINVETLYHDNDLILTPIISSQSG